MQRCGCYNQCCDCRIQELWTSRYMGLGWLSEGTWCLVLPAFPPASDCRLLTIKIFWCVLVRFAPCCQRIEQYLTSSFPGARVLRHDQQHFRTSIRGVSQPRRKPRSACLPQDHRGLRLRRRRKQEGDGTTAPQQV